MAKRFPQQILSLRRRPGQQAGGERQKLRTVLARLERNRRQEPGEFAADLCEHFQIALSNVGARALERVKRRVNLAHHLAESRLRLKQPLLQQHAFQ